MSQPTSELRLLLASASPRRRELLAVLGVPFATCSLDVDETPPPLPPPEAVLAIALRKLDAAPPAEQTLVLVADTVVVLGGRLLGKPADANAARGMLRDLRAREHQVLTAVAFEGAGTHRRSLVIGADVSMRDYTDAEIEQSIRAGTPFDKAGSYAIQDPHLHPVRSCRGCYCSVMGLPLWPIYRWLRAVGFARTVPPEVALTRCAACPLRDSES